MIEYPIIEYNPQEPIAAVNDWREVVNLPVIDKKRAWNSQELEDIIRDCIQVTVDQNLKDNHGQIHTTLSGGVDSSLCLAIIAELCPSDTPIHTYTVGSSDQHPDIQYARVVASLYNTAHHETVVNPEQEKEAITEFTAFYGDSEETRLKVKQGDVNVWIIYREIAKNEAVSVIAHDGIDEQMGGYWLHRKTAPEGKERQKQVFRDYWQRLASEHLIPLEQTAKYFGIKLLLPYLQKPLVRYIAGIPVAERASFKSGKMPLKEIAKKYFGQELRLKTIPDRKKFGFISALWRNNL